MSLASLFDMGKQKAPKPMSGVHMIDFSQIVIATVSNTFGKEKNVTFDLDMMRHVCLDTLRSNVERNKAMYPTTVICIDSKTGYWRRQVAYYYKKNRKKARDESDMDWDKIFEYLAIIVEEIKQFMPYITVDLPMTEADDTIGVICKYVDEKYPDCKLLITSSDGDFTQLHKFKNVKQWSPMFKKWVKCKHGSPRNDLRMKIIKGDKKDCIASIKSPSDYFLVREEGMKSPSISTVKYLEPLFKLDNPLESDIMSEDEKQRYKENEILLDFEFIPDNIRNAIIEKFEDTEIPKRAGLYNYFVSRRLSKLSTETHAF
ncbi:MAG: hypothetical protein ACRCWQ_14730 [Bacilli bacterium]